MSRTMVFRRILVVTILLCAAVCGSLAQNRPAQPTSPSAPAGTPGTFSGRLTGGGMDGATVTITNAATGASQKPRPTAMECSRLPI